uniref:RING-type E3 ubiquitin transferase n=1 Tax=Anthurium amnicola TaxID=1678845 RepID=A0A1D1Y9N9_9ARAE
MTERGEGEATPCEVDKKISNLHIRNPGLDNIVRDLEDKLKDKEELVDSLLRELEKLREKQEDEQKKADDLKRTVEVLESIFRTPKYSEFSYIELQQATNDFENSLKIGEGGYGSVYKGFLRHTTVAVKKLDCQSMQGLPEFYQEVDILTKVRHPNLVNFIGACSFPEPCLVYEFLPNGSLEDRLSRKDNTPPLSWQARIRITTEICSVLIFLHSHKPHAVVHGDLKPSNILLDAKFVTKLSDFGISRLLTQSSATTNVHRTEPKGTFAYIDPEFGHTGELTSSSDVYSFGVIILQLLTGRPALGLVKAVQDAFTSENLQTILDKSAGEWPFLQAKRLARLGIECCKMNRRSRPRLETEVWRVLEPMVRASSLVSSSFQLGQDNDSHAPSYFMCPILQEVMNDPLVAADGFTYEAEAIKGWFDSGHNTSPLTNLELPHHELLPNRALRSVIQEWLQQEQHHQ